MPPCPARKPRGPESGVRWAAPRAACAGNIPSFESLPMTAAPEDTLILTLDSGPVTIALRPDLAPGHVARIKELDREGFYDGVVFHRVIPGFMAQGGDPTATGRGGSDKPHLKAEFSKEPHVRGICSMARSSDPNSANSQFFIC